MSTEKNKELVPKRRFPEFRGKTAWITWPGNKLFEQISDKNPEPGLPVLAITQEHGAIPRDMIDYHVSVTDKSIESYKVVQVGDFIISLRSFQGGIEYSQYHGICSPAYVVLRRCAEGSDAYFKHYLKTDRFIQILTKNLEGLRDGKMISYKQFSELQIPTPTAAEQEKIADCLSSLDELIATQARKVEALKTHKKGLMQQLFPREGETQPRLRFPKFCKKGAWINVVAGDLFSNRVERGNAALPIYSVTMFDGLVPRNSIERRIDDIAESSANKKVYKGDITYNMMRMWQGAMGIAPEDCMVSPAYIVLKPVAANPQFFYYFLKQPHILRILTAHSRGLTEDRLRLYYDDFAKILLLCPSLEEQSFIANLLMVIDQYISIEAKSLDTLKIHKKSLLQQLFPSAKVVET
jgi:type I restriction enzyme S subunit